MSGDVTIHSHGPSPEHAAAAFRRASEHQMRAAMRHVEAEATRRAPFRTGHLRRSITSSVTVHGNQLVGLVGTSLPYAAFLEHGTGLYGPRNRRIVPLRARALRFPAGGGPSLFAGGRRVQGVAGPGFRLSGQQRAGAAGGQAQFVFARSVRGVMPRRFFGDAVEIARGPAVRELRLIAREARRLLGGGQ